MDKGMMPDVNNHANRCSVDKLVITTIYWFLKYVIFVREIKK